MWAPSRSRSPPPKRSPVVHNRVTRDQARPGRARPGDARPGRAWRGVIGGTAAAALLAACAVGPNYHRPETPVDGHFANAGEPGLKGGDTVEQYWTAFADPPLHGLVDDALAHNKDLGAAAANLQAARAAKRLAGFDQFPTATLAGSYNHILDSKQQLPFYDRHDREFDSAQGAFDGLWELDLFGRVRRYVEAAPGDLGPSAATVRAARLSRTPDGAPRDFIPLRPPRPLPPTTS